MFQIITARLGIREIFWDYAAAVYDLFVNVVNRKTHKKLRSIISGLIEPGDRVLECACGTGMLSAVIAEKGASLTATDFSRKMLKKAIRNCRTFSNIRFERADITDLRYPDGSFGITIAKGRIPCAVAVMQKKKTSNAWHQ